MIQLRGTQVILRTLEREHCRKLWDTYEPVEPIEPQPIQIGLSHEGANEWFEDIRAKQGTEQIYVGIFFPDGTLIGDIQLAHINWRNRTADLGFGLAKQKHRGKGYGTDAAITLTRYGFDHLNLIRINSSTLEYNIACQRSLEKCGFVQEGRERQAVYIDGKRWDRLIYGLLRSEFEKKHERPPPS